ncbi:hypothetical protein CHUAL_009124 [Chamberlinius hualienensis]
MAFIINSTPNTYINNWSVGRTITEQMRIAYNITDNDLDYWNQALTTRQTFNFTSSSPHSSEFCSQDFKAFRESFLDIHGVFSTIVCLFGLITNILNIIVLTRKDMVSPTNAILTGLAIADMLVMLDYLPFTLYTYILSGQLHRCVRYSYSLSWSTLFHAHFSIICHNVSIGLTLTLAVWRFIAVSHPQNNREWCSMSRAVLAIFICYFFIPLFTIPIILGFEIKMLQCLRDGIYLPTVTSSAISMTASAIGGASNPSSNANFDSNNPACLHNCTMYEIRFSDIALENGALIQNLNFWVYSVMVKLLPCIALTVLSLTLIRALYRTNRRRSQLKNRNCCNADRSCDRTTRMLLAILLLFLLTEFPQGILALLSGILGEKFYESCVQSFAEIVDLLALINSAINFILYCVMSKQFRQTFRQLFTPNIINNWISIQHEVTSTQATTCV